ncbi:MULTISPECIES: hypothetical protein [Nocardiopsis]|uniref:Glycosyltransferase RgtA/B/C/D-like domain-containing protein n=1 Tax=Nocardiopsis sinuspersici TaxID=501010 RepID=A0A1V3BWA4_9ACTN|nr:MULTISPECIES: hypothetical protein [Nocardiopsis]OOC52652.1 hypothetical protein NOSIN_01395 [Nocardiopsis sinuspersici]
MSPVPPTASGHGGSGAGTPAAVPAKAPDGPPRVRRPVEEPDEQGPGLGELARAALATGRRLARDRLVLAGLLVVAVAVGLRLHVLGESHFVEDDYLFFAKAYANDLGPDYLFSLHKGHLMPGALFLVYLQTAFWPYEWWVSAGSMLALQAAAMLVFLRLLWELFGRRWALLVPLTVYALAPLTVPVLGWWSAALNAVPLQLAMALALLWTVRYLRTEDLRVAWWAGGAVVFGMLFTVKAVFLPLLLFALAASHLYPGGPIAGARRAWALHRPFWAVMGGLFTAYMVFYLVRTRVEEGGEGASVPESGPALALLRGLLTEVFPIGALGGPLEWGPVTPAGGLIDPRGVMVLGAWAVFAAIVLVSLWMRRGSWRAWVLLLGYVVVVDVIPTVIARGRAHDVASIDPRYVADAALVFALCLALAYLPAREERARALVGGAGAGAAPTAAPYRTRPRRGARTAAVLATVVYAAAAGYSTHTYAQTLSGDRLQRYLDTVRTSLEDVPEEGGLYARPVPEDVVLDWNGARRLSSWVLTPLAPPEVARRMTVPEASGTAYVFDGSGSLVPARPADGSAVFVPGPGDDCLEPWKGMMAWPVLAYGGPTQIVTFGYTSEKDVGAVVALGSDWIEVDLPAAPEDGTWHVPVGASGEKLSLFLPEAPEDRGGLCLDWVSVGGMAPAAEGDPWVSEEDDRAGG